MDMNSTVKFKLTEKGKSVYNKFWKELTARLRRNFPKGSFADARPADDEMQMSLWEAFEIFGPDVSFPGDVLISDIREVL